MTADAFTFGGAEFYLLNPAANQWQPQPFAESPGGWVRPPAGTAVFAKPTSARFETKWTPTGGIQVLSDADYAVFAALVDSFATLTTPWGTKTARLTPALSLVRQSDGTYEGSATFEWVDA